METDFCVYRHIRPDKDEVFYIGKAKTDSKRPNDRVGRRNKIWNDIVDKNNGNYIVEIMLYKL